MRNPKVVLSKILLISLLSPVSYGAEQKGAKCPEWIKNRAQSKSIPVCPKNGSVLPETFPTAAVVVSDLGYNPDPQFTPSFVEKILSSSGDQTPLVILTGSHPSIVERVKKHIDSMTVSAAKKREWKEALVYAPSISYTWQQDYFEAFASSSGEISLREVGGYFKRVFGAKPKEDPVRRLAEAAEACGFTMGEPLKTRFPFKGGYMGGNIESLPGGFCLLGNDHFSNAIEWNDYADQVCGKDPKDRISVPTSWLSVGHTDEIMKVIPNKTKPEPCNFSVALASPRKAIELLRGAPNSPFIEFPQYDNRSSSELAAQRTKAYRGFGMLCRAVQSLPKSRQPKGPRDRKKPAGTFTDLFFQFYDLMIDRSYAGARRMEPSMEDCQNMTNRQVVEVLTSNDNLAKYNQLVQEKMDALKSHLHQQIKERLPQCQPDFVEVPDIFYGGRVVENGAGKSALPYGMALSILPNPTNAVAVGGTIVSPEPGNSAFKKYMASEYEKRGVDSEFIDTFDYAHSGEGNLHCASHVIRICRPGGE